MIFSPALMNILKKTLGPTPFQLPTTKIIDTLKTLNWINLPPVGTTSARRQGFLRHTLNTPSLDLKVLRGNVDTRLGRVAADEFSFIMLARAGIDRLNLYNEESMFTLPTQLSIPAPAQGIVAIECRDSDAELNGYLNALNHSNSSLSAALERTVLWLTGGNCHTALAVHHEGSLLNSWAEARGLRSQFSLSLETQDLEHWERQARSTQHGQLFLEMRRSSLTRSIQGQLLGAGYDKLMALRNPESLE
jgi:porphobilinogen deaminase